MYGLVLQIQHSGYSREDILNHELVLNAADLNLDLEVLLEV